MPFPRLTFFSSQNLGFSTFKLGGGILSNSNSQTKPAWMDGKTGT